MGNTKDYCRYGKAFLNPHLGAIAVGGIDLNRGTKPRTTNAESVPGRFLGRQEEANSLDVKDGESKLLVRSRD